MKRIEKMCENFRYPKHHSLLSIVCDQSVSKYYVFGTSVKILQHQTIEQRKELIDTSPYRLQESLAKQALPLFAGGVFAFDMSASRPCGELMAKA